MSNDQRPKSNVFDVGFWILDPGSYILEPGTLDLGLGFYDGGECTRAVATVTKNLEVSMTRKVVQTQKAPKAIGPYSQAIVHGDLVFAAGQIPLDPETGELVDGPIVAQAERVIKNLRSVLTEAGSELDKVLRLDVFLVDLSDFQKVNEYLAAVFLEEPPARVTVEVSGLPLGARIEMAVVAAV